ncbi:MAG TPA: helix-turn-helix domain-containing protein [Polyangiaceae bacterium]|nr:helix-turn-helix domain-containing protein [Polyangiaceae bacterium]
MAYLTLDQVSELTHAPVATVRWWIHTRKLPAFRPGRRLLVKSTDLTAFVEGASVAERGAERARAARKGARP